MEVCGISGKYGRSLCQPRQEIQQCSKPPPSDHTIMFCHKACGLGYFVLVRYTWYFDLFGLRGGGGVTFDTITHDVPHSLHADSKVDSKSMLSCSLIQKVLTD